MSYSCILMDTPTSGPVLHSVARPETSMALEDSLELSISGGVGQVAHEQAHLANTVLYSSSHHTQNPRGEVPGSKFIITLKN